MRIKSGFLLHSMGDEHVVVPVEDRTMEFQGMIRLNRSGVFLWERMQEEFTVDTLVTALLNKYEVTEETARASVETLVEKLLAAKVLEE